MAKIDTLPSLEVINTLKGTLDFYYWKGIPCVRKWPHIPHSSRTQASLTSAHLFGIIVQGWAFVGGAAKTLYIESAADQPRTARDLYVSGVLGGQHEASMSDFLDLLIECKDYLADLQALLGPLGSVDTDDLQIDIKAALSTLPVKGEDQLISIQGVLGDERDDIISGADGYVDSHACPENTYWKVTTACAVNTTSAVTTVNMFVRHDAANIMLNQEVAAIPKDQWSLWSGETWLDHSDTIRVYMVGAQAGDRIRVELTGHVVTLET